ncbi:MAG: beta-galactosidase [Solirubrobacterales bacterium]|nr:beta-galactosidase [Solirubrobacterales bacterium]
MSANSVAADRAFPEVQWPTDRIISGAFHYFRTHPDQWATRLHWLALMGLDTVETYVPWNLHEPEPGEYRFSGLADLERYLRLAAAEDLGVIVRPGPYICAEWDNGGLPSWVSYRHRARLRSSDPGFLAEVSRWFNKLLPIIARHQQHLGGPVRMLQLENEYGAFGSDTAYLSALYAMLREAGIEVPVVTSDGPEDYMLSGGSLPGVPATVNFGSRASAAFAQLRAQRPDDPLFCMEFWNGWFDHWGGSHHKRDAADAAGVLEEMLAAGASVNLYMAHGGTNFATWAGANFEPPAARHDGHYLATVTSYDYDAPLDERGAPRDKFYAYREVISRYRPVPELETFDVPLLEQTPTRSDGQPVPLAWVLDQAAEVRSAGPRSFEALGLTHGLVRYSTSLAGPRQPQTLTVEGLADRAHVALDGRRVAVLHRNDPPSFSLALEPGHHRLELTVESMGRVNYGRRIGEQKGILGDVLLDRQAIHGWTMTALSLTAELPELPPAGAADADTVSAFHRFAFDLCEPADTYLDIRGWGKGYAWVNGFALGRYWNVGPQLSLYVPGPVLKGGDNQLVLLELDQKGGPEPELVPAPLYRDS